MTTLDRSIVIDGFGTTTDDLSDSFSIGDLCEVLVTQNVSIGEELTVTGNTSKDGDDSASVTDSVKVIDETEPYEENYIQSQPDIGVIVI